MVFATPRLDHLVIDTRDRMDEAAARYQALGFQLTPRGTHTLGSINHLAMLQTDYLELLGFGAETTRQDIASFPIGANGLVFFTEDADALQAGLAQSGVPLAPANGFSRPVALEGHTHDARFRTTHMQPGVVPHGRLYFCEHQTPELVWRPEWQVHPNGAATVAAVAIAVPDPAAMAALYGRLFGPDALTVAGDSVTLQAGPVAIRFAPAAALAAEFGPAAADPAGRAAHIAAITLRTTSLAQAARVLHELPGVQATAVRVQVPAAAAMNVALEFVE